MTNVSELPPDQCRRLLRVGTVGRLAAVAGDGEILMLPINYVVIDDSVVMRTFVGSRLAGEVWSASHALSLRAAFEVDQVDHPRRRGWSVVVHGALSQVALADLGDHRLPRSWATGERDLFLALGIDSISGRKLGAGWDCESSMPARSVL